MSLNLDITFSQHFGTDPKHKNRMEAPDPGPLVRSDTRLKGAVMSSSQAPLLVNMNFSVDRLLFLCRCAAA